MILFALKFLLAHVIGDFVLQPYKWVKDKEIKKHKSKYVYLHVLIHVVVLVIVLGFDFGFWPYILLIGITHLIIDIGKLNLRTPKNNISIFFIDQLLHLAVIMTAVFIEFPLNVDVDSILSKNILITILALIFITSVASIVLQIIMSRWQLHEDQPENALKGAGKYIGVLERLFIFLFVVLGQWSAIGFLITAKSVFRFGDLSRAKDRKLTEYVLIGTLFSFLIAITTGLFYRYLIKI